MRLTCCSPEYYTICQVWIYKGIVEGSYHIMGDYMFDFVNKDLDMFVFITLICSSHINFSSIYIA